MRTNNFYIAALAILLLPCNNLMAAEDVKLGLLICNPINSSKNDSSIGTGRSPSIILRNMKGREGTRTVYLLHTVGWCELGYILH